VEKRGRTVGEIEKGSQDLPKHNRAGPARGLRVGKKAESTTTESGQVVQKGSLGLKTSRAVGVSRKKVPKEKKNNWGLAAPRQRGLRCGTNPRCGDSKI